MATFDSPPSSPDPSKRRTRTWARHCERYCCVAFTYFPLVFVYGITTWAVYVEAGIGLRPSQSKWLGLPNTILGVTLYVFLNASYTIAVFTDPGSPLTSGNSRGGYSHFPTTELPEFTSYTVSSSGGARYCKKCQCPKPDRTHHCSSCKRCVLKMDHHCPWLATCVGLRNCKAFLLFLIYTSAFCWVCFLTASLWVWNQLVFDPRYLDAMLPVNVIMLAILGGIIGLVLTGFMIWHVSLAVRGMTTIENLENTRYLSPVRKTLDRQRKEHQRSASTESGQGHEGFTRRLQDYGQQILDAHANAIPGVTRAEEGEERPSPTVRSRDYRHSLSSDGPDYFHTSAQHPSPTPAQQALYANYAELERQRERERYEEYLDHQDNEKMPNAFDLGWRQNLKHLFGENPLLWPFPVCNTTGDGWYWEPSSSFLEARERVRKRREREWGEWLEQQRHHASGLNTTGHPTHSRPIDGARIGAHHGSFERPTTGVSMKTLRPMSPQLRPGHNEYDGDTHGPGNLSPTYGNFDGDEAKRRLSTPPINSNRNWIAGRNGRLANIHNNRGSSDDWRDWD
ncbi:DHHC palmitoyltransferase domain containing protein [Elaphomyces granulatus]